MIYPTRIFKIVVLILLLTLARVLPVTAMSFDLQGNGGNCGTCTFVSASGEITPSTPTEFAKFVAEHNKDLWTWIIYLSSPGGSVASAMKLGREFRKLGATTVVGRSTSYEGTSFHEIDTAECLSACVLAFAGGKFRYYRSHFGGNFDTDKNALGVHQFYVSTGTNQEQLNVTAEVAKALGIEIAQVLLGVEMAYLAEMGVDPLLLTVAGTTAPTDIYVLTEGEALRYNLAMPQDLQPEWQLKFRRQGLYAGGHGSFEGDGYDIALWCPDHIQRQLLLALKVRVSANADFGEDRVRPYQPYIEPGGGASGNKKFPISFEKFDRKGDSIELTFGVAGTSLAFLQSGAEFRLSSDAPHVDQIIPFGTMRLDPRIVPTLLKTCVR
jgi:hypothetical protein